MIDVKITADPLSGYWHYDSLTTAVVDKAQLDIIFRWNGIKSLRNGGKGVPGAGEEGSGVLATMPGDGAILPLLVGTAGAGDIPPPNNRWRVSFLLLIS